MKVYVVPYFADIDIAIQSKLIQEYDYLNNPFPTHNKNHAKYMPLI